MAGSDEVEEAMRKMDSTPFLIDTLVNSSFYIDALIDNGCLCYSAFSQELVRQKKLPRIPIKHRELKLAKNDTQKRHIREITYIDLDIDGRKERVWGYVVKDLAYNLILGKPWMEHNDVIYLSRKRAIRFGGKKHGLVVREKGWYGAGAPHQVKAKVATIQSMKMIIGCHFSAEVNRARKATAKARRKREDPATTPANAITQVFAITMADINKALEVKTKQSDSDILARLPQSLKHQLPLFRDDDGKSLSPNRPGVDTAINLERDEQGREKEVPWGPLYGMSRDELLVLRKTLTELLDKNWVRASSSPGGAPVLFAKKPGGGLRFCVDYRALNAITQKDRYPLPLIRETLRAMSKARWFTKVDVRAAFHRLRIKEGDEWKTAFRTRFGLFEWLVTPFGLAGAPAAFQRYINSTLDEFLDWFCSAYLDDVLIYTDGSYEDHMAKVNMVLERLGAAGLKLDIKKCEFAVKQVKYLGFIITAGEGIKVDPEKVEAIRKWEAPTNVRGVRSFIGFANFYRDFIENFGDIAAPLLELTKKNTPFRWGTKEQAAFERLKTLFITAPVLALWDNDLDTVVEADCSGYAMGACLSQIDRQGRLRPVAYFSKKLSPAECNYEIHDKELLAIVRAMEEWRGELTGLVNRFTVLSDHKNLQHFMTARKLSERQVRWSQVLSQFNFQLRFRAGKKSLRPDALSRRQQDMPRGEEDERLRNRISQLLKDEWLPPNTIKYHQSQFVQEQLISAVRISPAATTHVKPPKGGLIFQEPDLQLLWDRGVVEDTDFSRMYESLSKGERSFPPDISHRLKVSISECSFDERGVLQFRNKTWIPDWEPLRTTLIQNTHDSHLTGHPGRDSTLAILSRSFYWPGISKMVRIFCRNCSICGRSHVWRERKRGLLHPLPIPDRFHSELSIDFMTDLPAREKGDPRFLMVIKDRLTKGVTLEAMDTMKAEACAERFVQCHYRFHGFPSAITSDRGSNWVGDFWRHLCKLVDIEQRLSTAFHPETDGSTERANQEVIAYLRAFISYSQYEWKDLLPTAMLALNNRDTVLGLSPFFLTHGYHIEPVPQVSPMARSSDPEKRAEAFVRRINDATEFAQASMASAQQIMEDSANRSRQAAERFKVNDRVWLNLKNINTPQLSKKLSWVNAKYRVTKVVSPHVVELDVPSGIFPKFHTDLLKRSAEDYLPSQKRDDAQPPPAIAQTPNQEAEYHVERILRAENRRRGRGFRREVLVKWKGYHEPNWEPRRELEDNAALDEFESRFGTGDGVGEDMGAYTGSKGKKTKRSN